MLKGVIKVLVVDAEDSETISPHRGQVLFPFIQRLLKYDILKWIISVNPTNEEKSVFSRSPSESSGCLISHVSPLGPNSFLYCYVNVGCLSPFPFPFAARSLLLSLSFSLSSDKMPHSVNEPRRRGQKGKREWGASSAGPPASTKSGMGRGRMSASRDHSDF